MPPVVDPGRGRHAGKARRHLAEAAAGALVERPVADHDVRGPGGNRHRRVRHRRAGRAAAVADLAEEAQLWQAQLAGDGDFRVAVHGEGDQAVHVRGGQASVVQGGGDGLDRQAKLAAPGLLGELGRADAGHSRHRLVRGDGHRQPSEPGELARRTVAVT
jgi:hypothetical protein